MIRSLLFACPISITMACGGRTTFTESEHPPSGHYRVTTTTRNDTCIPATTVGSFEDVVASNDDRLNITLWANFRGDLLWANSQWLEMTHCPFGKAVPSATVLRAAYDMRKLTRTSFELVSTWNWENPTACPDAAGAQLPSAPCSVEKTETFELIDPCPAMTSNLTCT
jgi:hypothetical protein